MAYEEFSGELDKPTEFEEFTGKLDKTPATNVDATTKPAPSLTERAGEVIKSIAGNASFLTNAAKVVGSTLDAAVYPTDEKDGLVGRTLRGVFGPKQEGQSVMKDFRATPEQEDASRQKRLSYGTGPIRPEVVAAAGEVKAGKAKAENQTVQRVADAMRRSGEESFPEKAARLKNDKALEYGAKLSKAKEWRSVGEFAKDAALNLSSGVVSLAQLPTNIVSPKSNFAEDLREAQKYLTEQESDVLNANRQLFAERIANEEGFLNQYVSTVGELVTNPTLTVAEILRQVPMFVGIIGAAKLTGAGVGAAFNVAERSSPVIALSNALSQGGVRAGVVGAGQTAGGMAASMTMAGGDAAGAAYERLTDPKQTPKAVWEKNPDYQRLTEKGVSHKDAVEEIATAKARAAAMIAAPLGLFGFMGAEAAFVGGIAKRVSPSKVVTRELIGEQIEEGGTQAAGNFGVQMVDPSQNLLEDVPQAMGTALITSGPFAAAGGLVQARTNRQILDQQKPDTFIDAEARFRLDPNSYDPTLVDPRQTTRPATQSFTSPDSLTAQAGLPPIVIPTPGATNVSAGDATRLATAAGSPVSGDLTGAGLGAAGLDPAVGRRPDTDTGRLDAVDGAPGAIPDAGGQQPARVAARPFERATDSDLLARATAAVAPELNNANTAQPVEQLFGRKGNGYVTEADAAQALPGRQRMFPNLQWSIEQMPSGKYRLAGYESQQATAPAPQAAAAPAPQAAAAPAEQAPAILQNRNRSTPVSVVQMRSIAANPDYGRLGFSRDFANGAPVVAGGQIAPEQLGRQDIAVAADGRRIPVQYAVVEADSLLPSNNVDGSPNPEYGDSSKNLIRAIAGNGRVAGLQSAFEKGAAEGYVSELQNDAMHGIDRGVIEGMQRPVLVRVMPMQSVTADIGDVSNTVSNLNLSPVEQANNDAQRVSLEALQFAEDGSITPQAVRQFVSAMPQTEQGGLVDSNGQPTKQAVDRINAAVFAKAYGSDELVRLYAQAQDPEARLILSALAQVAPKMARLEGAGALDIRSLVTDAAEIAVNARRNGMSIQRAAQQLDMTADPDVGVVLNLFARNNRSNREIVKALGRAADFAYREANKPAVDMFGETPRATRSDVLQQLEVQDEQAVQATLEDSAGGFFADQDAVGRTAGQERPGAPGETEARRPTQKGEVTDATQAPEAEQAEAQGQETPARAAKQPDLTEELARKQPGLREREIARLGDIRGAAEARLAAQQILNAYARRTGNPVPKLGAPDAEAETTISVMGRLFGDATGIGQRVFAYSDPGGDNGFSIRGSAFVNTAFDSGSIDAPRTALHELRHVAEQMGRAGNKAAQRFTNKVNAIFDDMTDAGKRAYLENFLRKNELDAIKDPAAREAKLQEFLRSDKLRSEMVADFIGNRSQDREFLIDLAKADPKGFEGFVKMWLAVIDNLIAKLRGSPTQGRKESALVDQYVRDLNKAKMVVRDALIEFRKANQAAQGGATAQGQTGAPAASMRQDGIDPKPATQADKRLAIAYEIENGILPYTSEGQIDVPVDTLVGPQFSIKQEGNYGNHPVLGIPVNKNGTVTLYYPSTNAEARRVARDKTLRAEPGSNRIYLTNESSAPKVMTSRGNIEQELEGANVLVQIDPSILQLDMEHSDGRKDFFIPIAEGQEFFKKMRLTRLFTQNAPRTKALTKDTKLTDLERRISDSVSKYLGLTSGEQRIRLKEAKTLLKREHNVTTLLGVNGKLEKTNTGGYGLNNYDGKDVKSMGLALASAQKINEKNLSTCPKSAICEGLCLGETSGQNLLYGGAGQYRSGPRLSQYLKTEALVVHPEEFAVVLHSEIKRLSRAAIKDDFKAAIRLNVTSDFRPETFKGLIEAFPDVMFYDYTKLPSRTIADNHYLTYSSTGASQVVNGKAIVNPESNWNKMVEVMRRGGNVAMAFSDKNTMPKYVVDENSGERFQVWDGDNYDARFLDPKPGSDGNEFNKGMIIGLTNKDSAGRADQAAEKNRGFFIDYNPERDGDTVVIRDQDKIKSSGQTRPIRIVRERDASKDEKPAFSRRQTDTTPIGNTKTVEVDGVTRPALNSDGRPIHPTVEGVRNFWRWFGESKVVDEQGRPLVVYRGAGEPFDSDKVSGPVFFGDAETANSYATERGYDGGANVTPVYLSLRKPANETDIISAAKSAGVYDETLPIYQFVHDAFGSEAKPTIEELKSRGFDGAILESDYSMDDPFTEVRSYVAFRPEQIKSATGNRGTFDPADSRIDYSRRQTDDLGFYSELAAKIEGGPNQAPPDQWRAFLKGLPAKGVKPDEILWSGVEDWLQLQTGKVKKQDVLDYLNANGVRVEEVQSESGTSMGTQDFSQWQLPGGENYREVLLTLPSKLGAISDETLSELDAELKRKGGTGISAEERRQLKSAANGTFDMLDDWEARLDVDVSQARAELSGAETPTGVFRSSHWDQPNVIAHIRLNDRTAADGKRVLFVEEVQSDWGQEGRDKGFSKTEHPKLAQLRKDRIQAIEAMEAASQADKFEAMNAVTQINAEIVRLGGQPQDRDTVQGNTPPAPFVTKTDGWLNLALKRVMIMAAEGGYDKVAFINGEQSADRYDLSKQISAVHVMRSTADNYRIKATSNSGNQVIDTHTSRDKLADVIGKDLAEKSMDGPVAKWQDFTGLDLKVGGEGMKTFYDKIVPNAVNGLLKKLGGGKIGEVNLGGEKLPEKGWKYVENEDGGYDILDPSGELTDIVYTEGEARSAVSNFSRGLDDYGKEYQDGPTKQPGFDITPAMREKIEDGVPMFSRKQGNVVGQNFTIPEMNRRDRGRRLLQDDGLRMKRVIEAVKKQGGKVGEAQNFYDAYTLMPGRLRGAIDDFRNKEIIPLAKKAAANGIDFNELSLYAYAKHAPERNAYIANINSQMPDGGSGMTNADAAKIVADVENSPKAAAMKELHQDLMAITATTLQTRLNEGLISQDEFDAMNSVYENYIPLRGFENVVEEERGGNIRPSAGRGINVRGKETIRALGRRSRAGDLIENVILDYQRVMQRVEMNDVGKVLLDFVLSNPDPKLWGVDVEKKVAGFDKNRGVVKYTKTIEKGEDTIGVKVGGEQVYIWFADTELTRALSQAWKTQASDLERMLIATTGVYNNLLRNMYTRYNPVFPLVNIPRDAAWSGPTAAIKELGFKGAGIYAMFYGKAMMASSRSEIGVTGTENKIFGNPEMDRFYEEFRAAGGMTGGWYVRSLEEINKDLRNDLLKAGAKPKTVAEIIKKNLWNETPGMSAALQAAGMNAVKANRVASYITASNFFKTLEFMGSASENATRFALYIAARKTGKNITDSALLAKNGTTNFDRKGEWGTTLNNLYLFFNPSIQGIAQFLYVLKSPKVSGVMTSVAGMAFMAALINAEAGGEDEDGAAYWDKIPGYEKERNLIIMLPPGDALGAGISRVGDRGRYMKFSVQYGFNIFPNMGYVIADVFRNRADPRKGLTPTKAALHLTSVLFGSINPFGGAIDLSDSVDVALAVAPTFLDLPIQIMTERDTFSRPSAPESASWDMRPDSERMFTSQMGTVPEKIAKALNRMGGGNEAKPGEVLGVETSVTPGTIKTIISATTGGLGSFFDQFATSVMAMASSDEDLKASNIPFVNKFYGEVDEGANMRIASERMREVKRESAVIINQFKVGLSPKIEGEEKRMLMLSDVQSKYEDWMTKLRENEIAIIKSKEMTEAEKKLARKQIRIARDELATTVNKLYLDSLKKE